MMRRSAVGAALLGVGAAVAGAVEGEVERLAKSRDRDDRVLAVERLAKDGSEEAMKLLVSLAEDDDPWVRDNVVLWAPRMTQPHQVKRLAGLAKAKAPLTRLNAADALAATKSVTVLPTLRALALDDRDADVRRGALAALAAFEKNEDAAAIASAAAADADPVLRATAVYAAERVRGTSARAVVDKALADPDDRVRAVALNRLGWMDEAAAVARLAQAKGDPSPRVRATCAALAWSFQTVECVDVLVAQLEDPDARTSALAHRILRQLAKKSFDRDPEVWRSWWGGARAAWKAPEKREQRRFTDDRYASPSQIYGAHLNSSCLTLLLDTSAPLARVKRGEEETRWAEVAGKVREAIGKLPDGTRVNLVTMDDEIRTALPAPSPLDARVRKRLEVFLSDVRPRGGCDFWGGLRTALDQPDVDTVVVISHGDRTRGDFATQRRVYVMAQQRYILTRAVVHTVWLKNDAEKSGELMRWIANDTLGVARLRDFP